MAVLKIDGIELELGNNKLVFSKKGYSYEDWLTKDIPYSERVTLPETSLLNTIFKRPYSPDIVGNKFNIFHTFEYSDNGKIVASGVAKLLDFNDSKEYEVQLLDSSFALFEALDNNLSALDLDSSDFVFNSTSYNNLKALNSSVWLWAASSMHEEKILSKNILSGNLSFSRPFFSVKRLVEAMLSANGWGYNLGSGADFFDNLIISHQEAFYFTSFEKKFNGVFTAGLLDLTSPDFINGDTPSLSTGISLANKSIFRIRGNIIADNDCILKVNVTGLKPQTQLFIINKGSFDYDLRTNEFESSHTISFEIVGAGNVTFTDLLIYTLIDENDFGVIASGNFIDYKVKTYDNLPDISQKELIKHALTTIGGFFNSDNYRKKLNIESIKNLSNLSALDWSDKFIEDSDSVTSLSGYGKINYYNYDNPDFVPFNLGRGTFLINNQTFNETTDIYNSVFAASQEVTITDTMIDNTIYNDTERINDINPLIGYYETVLTYTVARFDKLNGNSLLSEYYSNFITALKRGEVVDCLINLNKSDYFLFNFTNLVYLQQKKSVYYVLALSDYSENDLTNCTLLKY